MMKTLTGIAAAGALALTMTVAPQPAKAGDGGAFAAGAIGGLAAGANIGSAVANGPHYYGYGPGYAYAPGPVYYGPRCWWSHRRVWNGYRWHRARVRVCR
jgi:hypothetical protein